MMFEVQIRGQMSFNQVSSILFESENAIRVAIKLGFLLGIDLMSRCLSILAIARTLHHFGEKATFFLDFDLGILILALCQLLGHTPMILTNDDPNGKTKLEWDYPATIFSSTATPKPLLMAKAPK